MLNSSRLSRHHLVYDEPSACLDLEAATQSPKRNIFLASVSMKMVIIYYLHVAFNNILPYRRIVDIGVDDGKYLENR